MFHVKLLNFSIHANTLMHTLCEEYMQQHNWYCKGQISQPEKVISSVNAGNNILYLGGFIPNCVLNCHVFISWWLCCVFCAECSMNVHHKCQKKVANLCGVNQKLMAEALAMIESKQQVRKTNILLFKHV